MPKPYRLTWMITAAFGLLLSASQIHAQQQDPGDQPGLVADDAYQADPEWQKLRATPGLTDPEIVSNISNSILRPLAFSPIR